MDRQKLLIVDDDIRRGILGHADANELRQLAKGHGMRTLFQDGAAKIAQGVTTLGEVFRVTQEG